MKGRGKILVVDDHVALAENIAEILEVVGYEAIVADSAESALARVEEPGVEIVALITDFKLPGRSGAELIRELRRGGHDVPVLVMSAYTDEGTIQDSERAGALHVIPKPVDVSGLLTRVAELGRADPEILVVDDDRAFAENLAEALAGLGHRATVGTSAAEALAVRTRPRAAILDVRLPDRSGPEVAEVLAARDPRISIIFISGHCEELGRVVPDGLGRVRCVEKPASIEHIVRWADEVLGHGSRERPGR